MVGTSGLPVTSEQSYTDIQKCEYWFHESDTILAALIRFASDPPCLLPIADVES